MDFKEILQLLAERVWIVVLIYVVQFKYFHNSTADIILPPVESGCTSNNDCPDYTACQNRKCINPCAADNICAPNAICTVTRHRALCACPDGYIGTPEISCSLRKYILSQRLHFVLTFFTSTQMEIVVLIWHHFGVFCKMTNKSKTTGLNKKYHTTFQSWHNLCMIAVYNL